MSMPYRIMSPVTHTRIGRRGACLLVFGLIPALIGVSYFVQPTTAAGRDRGVPVLDCIAPPEVWAVIWIVLGSAAFLSAFGRWRWTQAGYVVAYILPLIWGASYLISWILGKLVTGWISAVIYLGYSLLVTVIAGWEESAGPLETHRLTDGPHDA